MFIEVTDFSSIVDTKSLDVIMQSEETNLDKAITQAIEEASGYLRSRYDVEATFAATGTARNSKLVLIIADIALYNLIAWLPAKLASEIRTLRYEYAINWLKDVQKGIIQPNLPLAGSASGTEEEHQAIQWGSSEKNNNEW